MSLLVQQQIFEIVKRKQRVLIAIAKNFNGDALAAAVSLSLFLKKLEKDVALVCDEFKAPEKLKFLPQINRVQPLLQSPRKFVISLDLTKTKVENLSYQIKDNRLEIYINPKDGQFASQDVTCAAANYRYDLIFVLDSPDLESLGKVYEDNADFFYQTPIVNIDHSAENENFGQINLVDLNANSTCEILFSLLENNLNVLEEDLATALYTGIIVETNSFKSNRVTPKTLNIAAQLIAAGARREEVIKNLFRTYSLATFKLWGRALARLKEDYDGKLVWSIISQDDFAKTETQEENLQGVAEELMLSLPKVEAVLLIYQKAENTTAAFIYTKKNLDARDLVSPYHPAGNKNQAHFHLADKNLLEAEEEIIKVVKENLSQALI